MPSLFVRRGTAAILSLTLLAGTTTMAVAVDDSGADEPVFDPVAAVGFAPPSLEVALTALASSVTPAKVRLPACTYQDIRTRYGKLEDWKKTLLDTNLKVRRSYQPRDLVSVSSAGLSGSGKVRKIIIDDLRALAAAARRAGKPLAVRSAQRTYSYQAALFASYVQRFGYTHAASFSARPGHSEHQMGTTLDFTTAPSVPLKTTFGESPSGKWLAKNGWKYGFIMSYPKGKQKVSCYSYEPWHWRYFGRDLARKIYQSGQVPRRYLYENFEVRR